VAGTQHRQAVTRSLNSATPEQLLWTAPLPAINLLKALRLLKGYQIKFRYDSCAQK